MEKTRLILLTASLLLLLLFSAEIVLAKTGTTTTTTPEAAKDIIIRINEVLCALVNFSTIAAAGIVALAIMLAGIKYMSSQDDPSARNRAKNTIIYAVIGLGLVLLACPLIDYIITDTDIIPFENSCTCIVTFNAPEPRSTTTTTKIGTTTTIKGTTTTLGITTTKPITTTTKSATTTAKPTTTTTTTTSTATTLTGKCATDGICEIANKEGTCVGLCAFINLGVSVDECCTECGYCCSCVGTGNCILGCK